MFTDKTVRTWSPYCSKAFCRADRSLRQYGHQVAQKFRSTILPRRPLKETFLPSKSLRVKSGAIAPIAGATTGAPVARRAIVVGVAVTLDGEDVVLADGADVTDIAMILSVRPEHAVAAEAIVTIMGTANQCNKLGNLIKCVLLNE